MALFIKANLKEAISSLSASMQRSLLALIGIVIGISSVIAMISVGTIVRSEAARQFQELGTDILTVHNISRHTETPRGTAATIDLTDALALTTLSTIETSAPYMGLSRASRSLPAKRPHKCPLSE